MSQDIPEWQAGAGISAEPWNVDIDLIHWRIRQNLLKLVQRHEKHLETILVFWKVNYFELPEYCISAFNLLHIVNLHKFQLRPAEIVHSPADQHDSNISISRRCVLNKSECYMKTVVWRFSCHVTLNSMFKITALQQGASNFTKYIAKEQRRRKCHMCEPYFKEQNSRTKKVTTVILKNTF